MTKTIYRVRLAALMMVLNWISMTEAHADVLYVTLGPGLYRLNTDTLASTLVGNTGFTDIGGLAFDNNGTLFGINGGAPGQLVRLNINTGVGSLVAPITGVTVSLSTSLANDPTTNTLYGMSLNGPNPNVLMTISKLNGNPSVLGAMPTSVGMNGLSFDQGGTLWGIDAEHEELVRINKTNASLTVVATNSLAAYPTLADLAVGPTGRFWSIKLSWVVLVLPYMDA
jgi:hypothetical protein